MKIFIIMLITLVFLSNIVAAEDELIIIHAISSTKKSFVIRKGAKDGIASGQESLFSNSNASIRAVSTAVTREFSTWELKEPEARIPYVKGQFVTFNEAVDTIWFKIPDLENKFDNMVFVPEHRWIARLNFTTNINQSISEVSAEQIESTTGFQFEALYSKKVRTSFDWAIGVRIDQQSTQMNEPSLTVTKTRHILISDFTYHLLSKYSPSHYYISLGIGAGRSQTKVSESVSTGTALVLPFGRFGYEYQITRDYKMLTEVVLESVTSSETFEDSPEQTSNETVFKGSIGFKF